MKRVLLAVGRVLGATGRATVALVGICGVVAAMANYTMTQGAGTSFGSVVVSTVHYAQMMLCDLTTPSQCAAVDSTGKVSVKDVDVVAAINSSIPTGSNVIGALSPNQSINNNQWGGVNLGSPSAYGTSPGAINVPGVNAFITNSPTVIPAAGAPVSCSVTVTTGGTAQNAFTGQSNVRNVTVMDIDTGKTEGIWVSWLGTAAPNTVDSFYVPPYSATSGAGSFSSPPGIAISALSVYAATTGHKVSCSRS